MTENQRIAETFRDISCLLQLKGDNPFRIRAYERAASTIENLAGDIKEIAQSGKLTGIEGIGRDLAEKINDIITTGTTPIYGRLTQEFPPGLIEMMRIPGLGPKTVKLIFEATGADSPEKLEKAVEGGQLTGLAGIREKTLDNILRGITVYKRGGERTLNPAGHALADKFIDSLEKLNKVKKVSAAGSLRREKDSVKDIDILVQSDSPQTVMENFINSPLAGKVIEHGSSKSSVIAVEHNLQVDLRVVEEKSYGAALLYFTGSKEFNIKLREYAISRGRKLNEYGIFDNKEKYLAGKTEEEIFKLLEMDYIPPELREDRGEIDAARKRDLPRLITTGDIKGDLHVHSTYSDGQSTIEADAAEAVRLGYRYVAICDHSQSLRVAKGLSRKELNKKIAHIRGLNRKYKNFKILYGTEVDIGNDGSLDYPDEILKEFDVVVAAIHTGFKQSRKQLTRRIVKACKNKYVHIVAHPTGKLSGQREAYDIDLTEIFKAAGDHRTAMEINSYPQRLDLSDIHAMQAGKMGVKLAIDTDSHHARQMAWMNLGVNVGRRAWLTKNDVINCLGTEELLKWLKK